MKPNVMWGIKLVVLIEGDQYLLVLVTTLMPTRRLNSSSLEQSFKTFVTFYSPPCKDSSKPLVQLCYFKDLDLCLVI